MATDTCNLALARPTVFCDNNFCQRAIFAERIPGMVAYQRTAYRELDGWFTYVSFTLREGGAKLLSELGVRFLKTSETCKGANLRIILAHAYYQTSQAIVLLPI